MEHSEWGFPKGRRDRYIENDIACASREFEERNGYQKKNYVILDKIEPIEEIFAGTDGITYKTFIIWR